MNKFNKLLIAVGLFALTGIAAAVPINGSIFIGGASTVLNDGTNSTGIDFTGGSVNTFPAPSGDFLGLGGITTSTGLVLNDFLYTEIPQKTIWTITSGATSFSFTLTSVNAVTGDFGDFSTLGLKGTGFFSSTTAGFEDTFGSWTFSQSGASFSSETVPGPAPLIIMGLGLFGISVARNLRKA